MTISVVVIFCIVYLGMVLGGLPFLSLDRAGIALLGAIALLTIGELTLDEAAQAIHLPTIILLFAFMVVSAQLRLGGFYAWVTVRIGGLRSVAAGAARRSDIRGCRPVGGVQQRHRVPRGRARAGRRVPQEADCDPLPFLLALACAANVGSAATLIGNPQNMLIGEKLQLVVLRLSRGRRSARAARPACSPGRSSRGRRAAAGSALRVRGSHCGRADRRTEDEAFDRWQTVKGLSVAAVLLRRAFCSRPGRARSSRSPAAGVLMLISASCTRATCSAWSTGSCWCCSWACSW